MKRATKAEKARAYALIGFDLPDPAVKQVCNLLNRLPNEDIRRNLGIGRDQNVQRLVNIQRYLYTYRTDSQARRLWTGCVGDWLKTASELHKAIRVAERLMEIT